MKKKKPTQNLIVSHSIHQPAKCMAFNLQFIYGLNHFNFLNKRQTGRNITECACMRHILNTAAADTYIYIGKCVEQRNAEMFWNWFSNLTLSISFCFCFESLYFYSIRKHPNGKTLYSLFSIIFLLFFIHRKTAFNRIKENAIRFTGFEHQSVFEVLIHAQVDDIDSEKCLVFFCWIK